MWHEAPIADSLDMHDPCMCRIRIAAFDGCYGAPLDGNYRLGGTWPCFICLWCGYNDVDWWFQANASMCTGHGYWTVKIVHFLHTDYRLVRIQSVVDIGDRDWILYWMALVLKSSVLVPTSDTILMPLIFSIFYGGILSLWHDMSNASSPFRLGGCSIRSIMQMNGLGALRVQGLSVSSRYALDLCYNTVRAVRQHG